MLGSRYYWNSWNQEKIFQVKPFQSKTNFQLRLCFITAGAALSVNCARGFLLQFPSICNPEFRTKHRSRIGLTAVHHFEFQKSSPTPATELLMVETYVISRQCLDQQMLTPDPACCKWCVHHRCKTHQIKSMSTYPGKKNWRYHLCHISSILSSNHLAKAKPHH